jgi:hypothetical protein
MAFDPSIISQIPSLAAGDPMGSVGKAYGLKDLINREQMNTLKLGQERQQLSQSVQAKKILSGEDISTPEGLMKASEKLNKAGLTDQAMGLLKEARSERVQQAQLDEYKIAALKASADILGPAALQIKQTLASQGPAAARAQYAQTVAAILPQLPENMRGSIPAQPPQNDQQFGQLLDRSIGTSSAAKQMLAQQLAERKQDVSEKREATYERSVEGNLEDKTARRKALTEGLMPPEDLKFMAKQYIAGDKSVMQNLGRGAQGSKNIIAMRSAIREEAQLENLSPEQIAGRIAEFNATVAEERKIGNIAGGVEYASAELDKFIPLALSASSKVPRGTFVPFNKLIQAGESSISDPNLKRLYVNTQGVLNAYDVLAARGGSDVGKREHTRQMLMTADSPQAYATALDAIKQELTVAGEAGKEAKAKVAGEVGGKPAAPAAPDASGWGKASVVQ